MLESDRKLADSSARGHLKRIGMALTCMILMACDTFSQEQPPRTLSELLGQSPQELVGRSTKTELTADSLIRMGVELESKGEYTGAMRFYTQAAQLEPNNIRALTGIGNVYLAVGIWNAGLNAFQQVRALDPRGPQSAAGLAVALLLNDRPGEARQILNKQMAMTGPAVDLQNFLGLAEDLLGNHEAAQNAYSAALKPNPGDGEILTNLALSLALMGAYERAEAILEGGSGTPNSIAAAGQNLALVYALRGQLPQAVEAAQRELPIAEVEQNRSFYERLPKLSAHDRARAVFFGTLPLGEQTLVEPAPQQPTPAVTPSLQTPGPATTEAPQPEPKIEVQPLPRERTEQPAAEKPLIEEKPPAPQITEPQPEPQPGTEIEVEPAEVVAPEPETETPGGLHPEPGSEQPEQLPAETLIPEVSEPEVSEPETNEPEISKPEATGPETKKPEVSGPEITEPEILEPATQGPKTQEPETSAPDTSEPKTTDPEVTEPETTEPQTTEPETAEPQATDPEVTEQQTTDPEVTEPEVTEPEANKPELDLGPYWVQIGSYRQADQIRAGWATLNRQHGPALEETVPYAQHHDGGERGMFWRLLTSPAEERAIAQGDCELLLYAGLECFVIRTSGDIQLLSADLKD
jgi:Flp pilus assembly protein TadD